MTRESGGAWSARRRVAGPAAAVDGGGAATAKRLAAGLAAAVIVAVLAAGCGGDDPAPAPGGNGDAGVTETATPAAARRPSVDITRPSAGARVRAQAAAGGRLRATVTVQGFAAPGSRVRARSGCDADPCRAAAKAGDGGIWRLRLRLVASKARPRATISATSSVPGPARRRSVRLVPEKPAAPARHRGRHGHGRNPVPAPTPPAASATPPPAAMAPPTRTPIHRLVLIGDSLGVGIQNLLPSLLPGWTISADALTGRTLAAGMQLAEAADLTSQPTVLAISLFTNDDPRATAALASAVQRSVALAGPHGCAVWATIVRPPLNGVSYDAANQTLRQLAAGYGGALLLVPWAEEVARHPDWVAPDGVHGTPAGYQARAAMYARAALSCNR